MQKVKYSNCSIETNIACQFYCFGFYRSLDSKVEKNIRLDYN